MSTSTDLPVIILGSGGHARVIAECLLASDIAIIGFTDPSPCFDAWQGIQVIGDDTAISEYDTDSIRLANGIGALPFTSLRQTLFKQFTELGYCFQTCIHPTAYIAPSVTLEEGCQILARAFIQTGSCVGKDTIINSSSSIDHDCNIGDFCHLAPGTTLSGGVNLAQGVHIGTGACVIQDIDIGADTVIGAGATITCHVKKKQVVRAPEVSIQHLRG